MRWGLRWEFSSLVPPSPPIFSVARKAEVLQIGILVINNYQPTLYATLGYGTERQLLLTGGWITLAWGCGILGCFIIDSLPRPKLIAGALAGCMVCLIIVAALIANFVPSDNDSALQAIIAMLYVYVVFYEGGRDGTQFAYLGELFPTHLRAKGMNLGVAGICLMNIVWLQSAPTGIANANWKVSDSMSRLYSGYVFD